MGNTYHATPSADEEALVDSIVRRKVRFSVLSEQHAAVARSRGPEIFSQACADASRALAPKQVEK